MRLKCRVCVLLAGAMATTVMGQVSLSYSPTTIEAGVETEITVSVTNTSDTDFDLCGVFLNLFADDDLDVVSFRWLQPNFLDPLLWFVVEGVPRSQATPAVGSDDTLAVPAGVPVPLGLVTVRAAASSAGSSLTLDFVPTTDRNGAMADSVIADCGFFVLAIDSGRSVVLTVTGPSTGGDDGSGGGGSGGGGSGGGTGGGTGGGMPGDDGMTGDDGMAGDGGTDLPGDGNMGDGTDMNMNGDDDGMTPDDGDGMRPTDGDDPVGDDGGGDNSNGDDGMMPDNGTGGDAMEPTMPAGFCAPAMMMPTLFSLLSLSVMKRRRRRSG